MKIWEVITKNKYLSIAIAVIALIVISTLNLRGCDKSIDYMSEKVTTVEHRSNPQSIPFQSQRVQSSTRAIPPSIRRGSRTDIWSVKPDPGFILDYANAQIDFERLYGGCNNDSRATWHTRTANLIKVLTSTVSDRRLGATCITRTTITYTQYPASGRLQQGLKEGETFDVKPSFGFYIEPDSARIIRVEKLHGGCDENTTARLTHKTPALLQVSLTTKAQKRNGASCQTKVTIGYNQRLNIIPFLD